MRGGDISAILDRLSYWPRFSFTFLFLCPLSFSSCCMVRLLLNLCFSNKFGILQMMGEVFGIRDDCMDEEQNGAGGTPHALH